MAYTFGTDNGGDIACANLGEVQYFSIIEVSGSWYVFAVLDAGRVQLNAVGYANSTLANAALVTLLGTENVVSI